VHNATVAYQIGLESSRFVVRAVGAPHKADGVAREVVTVGAEPGSIFIATMVFQVSIDDARFYQAAH
jgi:hypothetical protein